MAGDADMGFNEIIGRIATLEALALKLLEIEARRRREDGQASLDGFVHSVVDAVAIRTASCPELQKQFVSAHLDKVLGALSELLQPDARAKN